MMKEPIMAIFEKTTPMPLYGLEHLLPVLFLILFVGFLVSFRMSVIPRRFWKQLGSVIGWVLCLNYPCYVFFQFLDGGLSWQTSLPLYPCVFGSLLAPIYSRTKNKTLFNILFYWVFAGALWAVITPEVKSTFPHYEYFYFWVCHFGLFAFLFMALVIDESEPSARGVWSAFVAVGGLVAISAVVNSMTGANYYYLVEKPSVPTLMDYLGPWPWYVVGVIGVSLVQFLLAFVVFRLIKWALMVLQTRDVEVEPEKHGGDNSISEVDKIMTTCKATSVGGSNGA